MPVGCWAAYSSRNTPTAQLNWWIRFTADVINGVPSITWGMVVYALMVVPMKGFSTLAGAVVLGLMMIPLIMRTTEEVLQLVPNGYREAALALGIAQWRMIAQIVRPHRHQGHRHRRAAGAGPRGGGNRAAAVHRLWQCLLDARLTEPIAALPLQIFNYAISPYDDWHRQAWAGALVLILLVSSINVGVRVLTRDRFAGRGS